MIIPAEMSTQRLTIFLIFFLGGWISIWGEEAAAEGVPEAEVKFKLDLNEEPEVIRQILLDLTPPGTDVYAVARAIVKTVWKNEQAHKLKHKSDSYYFEREFHGEGYILVELGGTSGFGSAWKKRPVHAIYVFDKRRVLQDILIKKK